MTKAVKLLAPSEHAEQAQVIAWARIAVSRWPELELLFAIPNQGRHGGRRGRFWGARMAEEGLRGGVPDLMLPVARGGFHGLFVELKRTVGGRVNPRQAAWHEMLREAGYQVVVARGAKEAIAEVERYLWLSVP